MLLLPNNVVGKQPSGLAIITLNQGKGCSWGKKVGLNKGSQWAGDRKPQTEQDKTDMSSSHNHASNN